MHVVIFLLLVGLANFFAGCGKQMTKQQKSEKFLYESQMAYDVTLCSFKKELEIVKSNEQSGNKLSKLEITDMLADSICTQKQKQSTFDWFMGNDTQLHIPLHRYSNKIEHNIAFLKYYCAKLKRKSFDEQQLLQATVLMDSIQALIDDLYFLDKLITSNREFRDEKRYLSQKRI